MSVPIISFDREFEARHFACPDSSKMRWSVFGEEGAQCRGCSGMCGQSIPLKGQVAAPTQTDLFTFDRASIPEQQAAPVFDEPSSEIPASFADRRAGEFTQ